MTLVEIQFRKTSGPFLDNVSVCLTSEDLDVRHPAPANIPSSPVSVEISTCFVSFKYVSQLIVITGPKASRLGTSSNRCNGRDLQGSLIREALRHTKTASDANQRAVYDP